MNSGFEKFFILTHPLYWLCLIVLYTLKPFVWLIGRIRTAIVDTYFYYYQMDDLSFKKLNRLLKVMGTGKGFLFRKRLSRIIKYKAINLFRIEFKKRLKK